MDSHSRFGAAKALIGLNVVVLLKIVCKFFSLTVIGLWVARRPLQATGCHHLNTLICKEVLFLLYVLILT